MSSPVPEMSRGHGYERLSSREADLLRELAETINASLDTDAVLQRVAETARDLCRSDVARIALREPGADGFTFRYRVGPELQGFQEREGTIIRRLVEEVLATGRAVRKADAVTVPVRIRDRVEALIQVANRAPRPFGERDEEVLRRLAEHAAVAIRNSRLVAAERKAAEQVGLLGEVSTLLAGSLDYEATLQRLARLTVPALADMCVIDMLADDGTIRRVAAAHARPDLWPLVATVQERFPPDPKGPHPVTTVLRTGRPQVAPEITESMLAAIAPDPQHRQIARALTYTSFIIVPLMARGRTLGALSLVSGQAGRRYGPEDLALAEDLARRASLAVDNARLYTESEQRRRIAEALTATGRLLSQTLNVEEVAQRVVGSLRELIGALCVIVYRLDPDTGACVPLAVSGDRGLPERLPLPAGMGTVGLALRERRTAVTEDLINDPRMVLGEPLREALRTAPRAGLAVPLMVQDETIGALFLGDRAGRRFTADEVRLAEAFADQAAIAFNNARLYAVQEVRAERLRILAHVNRLVSSSLEIDEVLDGISRMAAEIMGIAVVTLWIVDADNGIATLRACSSERHRRDYPIEALPLTGNLIAVVAADRRPIHVPDVFENELVPHPAWHRAHGLRSVFGFPIVWRQIVLGVLALHSAQPLRLSPDDESLAQMFAAQAAVALRNAQLYQEAQHRQREAEAVALQAERARSEAEAATAELRRLQGITDVALAALGVEDLLRELLTRVRDVLGVDTAAVFLVDQERQVLVPRAVSGLEAGDDLAPIPIGRGFSGQVVLARGPMVAEDIAKKVELHASVLSERGIRSLLGAPLLVGGWATGIIRVGSTQPRRFSEDDARLLQLVADRVALAIENAQLHEADRQARSEAEAASRAKDHFLAMLAHELRNPLAPIRSGFYVIGERLGDDPVVQRAREIVERQLLHLTRLLDDLLDVARITQGKIELVKVPLEIGSAVAEAMESTRSLIESRGHTIRVDLPNTPIRVEADPTRIVQIIGNLLNNAAKYTPPGGSIVLTAGQEAGWVVLSVSDTGVGIPDEMLPRIFDLFAQVDPSLARSEGGLGIGLTLVRRLVELHGGDVSARSEGKGRGSEFIARLPAASLHPASSNAPPAAAPGPACSVLVVEDNVDSAQMLQACLELAGHRVLVADNGVDAVTVALRERPDVMLVDIGLPVLDGNEVARRVRAALGPAVLLIALTGYGRPQDRQQALEAGFDDHVVKPVDPEQLTSLIARAAR
ncbi:MAG TPA: GAF domain-containing protein [Methylomirabilota bacterium]|nr:GAF domain-containing protein [Methylomirabilota bacterium]